MPIGGSGKDEAMQVAGIGSYLREKFGMETAEERKAKGKEKPKGKREKSLEEAEKKGTA